jgi:hypothetical protein
MMIGLNCFKIKIIGIIGITVIIFVIKFIITRFTILVGFQSFIYHLIISKSYY